MLHTLWTFIRDLVLGTWQDPHGYNFISGPLADSSILVGIYLFLSKHVCHAHGCFRPGRHAVAGTPYVCCRKHHPDMPDGKITVEHIHAAHAKALAGVSGPETSNLGE